jgi:hypothetical protein
LPGYATNTGGYSSREVAQDEIILRQNMGIREQKRAKKGRNYLWKVLAVVGASY